MWVAVAVAAVLARRLGGAGQSRRFVRRAGSCCAYRQTFEGVDPEETETVIGGDREEIVPMPLGGVVVAAE